MPKGRPARTVGAWYWRGKTGTSDFLVHVKGQANGLYLCHQYVIKNRKVLMHTDGWLSMKRQYDRATLPELLAVDGLNLTLGDMIVLSSGRAAIRHLERVANSGGSPK